MSKIVSKKISWNDANIAQEGVVSFNLYYAKPGPATYDSPKVNVPVVEGQTAYELDIPAQVPIEEGQYEIGVSALDAAGNESDIAVLDYFFDFTAPGTPTDLGVKE